MNSGAIHFPKGKRLTKSKQVILDYFSNSEEHTTADELYKKLITQLPGICLATVYRNLNDLASLGILKQLSYPNMPVYYEYAGEAHSHFYCDYCHKIYDVEVPSNSIEANRAYHGHYIKDVNIELKGICKNCLVNYFG